jgi:DNA-binding GntR family transcriptional regulator
MTASGYLGYTEKVSNIVSNSAAVIDADAAGRGSLVARAAAVIRSLVLQRYLLPGEQVRQEDLSAMVGISRGPIREALQILASEGVVRYERNRGYFVARFTVEEMRQLYLIRDLLESEILSGLAAVPSETIETMRAINERIRHGNDDLQTVIGLNSQFHDLVFASSDLHIFRAELRHIGRMTMAYQSLSINALTNWELLASDHDDIIDALALQDNARLVEVCRTHRDRSLIRLSPLLG